MAERITIIGLGLIGSSLGMALKKAKLNGVELAGHDRDPKAAAVAHKRGAVDKTHMNLFEAIKDARLIIIATPIGAIRETLELIGPHLQEGTVVTETGSTKVAVLKWAEQYLPSIVSFVGGHPMVGSEQSGPEAADPNLFAGATYCICPAKNAAADAVQSIVGLAETVGAKPYFMDPVEHDSYAAAVSHLPMLLSTTLVNCTTRSQAWREIVKLASSGYRDVSRLASGDPEMHRDICLTNQEGIVYWIDEFIKGLYDLRRMVKDGDEALLKTLINAWEARARWQAGVEPVQPGASLPRASESMMALFVGERMARRMQDLTKREREREDKTKYKKG